MPGPRALTVTNLAGGLAGRLRQRAGDGRARVITGAAPLQPGATVTLQVAHVLAEGRVAFLAA